MTRIRLQLVLLLHQRTFKQKHSTKQQRNTTHDNTESNSTATHPSHLCACAHNKIHNVSITQLFALSSISNSKHQHRRSPLRLAKPFHSTPAIAPIVQCQTRTNAQNFGRASAHPKEPFQLRCIRRGQSFLALRFIPCTTKNSLGLSRPQRLLCHIAFTFHSLLRPRLAPSPLAFLNHPTPINIST